MHACCAADQCLFAGRVLWGKGPVLSVALQQRNQGVANLHPLGFPRRAFIALKLLTLRPKSLCQFGLLHTLQAMYQCSLLLQMLWHCLLQKHTVDTLC